jgi:Domain of unknown function (DUF4331)
MSSHREAPEISKDPVADNTDVYAFVSPDKPDTVTLIANFIPLQLPYGGPNFFEFGDDVRYEIHVSNAGDGRADVTYRFRFTTVVRNRATFLYNTGPIDRIDSPAWNRPQFLTVTRVDRSGRTTVLGRDLAVPPVNVGVRSTPNYDATFTAAATHRLPGGRLVFTGQRAESFHVDLGSIFDLGVLRPFQAAHLIPSAAAVGVNGTQGLNVHTIAIQVPKTDLTRSGRRPTDVMDQASVIGVYASASRPRSRVFDPDTGRTVGAGPFRQVSRLANPLFNEVLVPMAAKDRWNARDPHTDRDFARYVTKPELAALLPVLYPGVFPRLAAYTKPRADLAAILLTGIPAGVVPGFQNFTGPTQADLLRLNLAVPPAATPNVLGVIGGDLAGFPNGRRLVDDVVTIELRAVAGATIPLVDPTFRPDAAAAAVTDGTTDTDAGFTDHFPYVGAPAGGYQSRPGTPPA